MDPKTSDPKSDTKRSVSTGKKAKKTQHAKVHEKENKQEPAPSEEKQPEIKEVNLDYKDQYLRIYAEFENFKKRSHKERSEWIQMAGKDILLAMIEVLDDCDRASKELVKLQPNEESIKKTQEGIQLVFTKLKTKLGDFGIKAIESTGNNFDINVHEAVTEVEDKNKKGKIVAEVQKGYMLHEKVIRYAKVVIGK